MLRPEVVWDPVGGVGVGLDVYNSFFSSSCRGDQVVRFSGSVSQLLHASASRCHISSTHTKLALVWITVRDSIGSATLAFVGLCTVRVSCHFLKQAREKSSRSGSIAGYMVPHTTSGKLTRLNMWHTHERCLWDTIDREVCSWFTRSR